MNDALNPVSQADYMKLFMQELSYQDPLKPIDNREFMTQMAQFSVLQQAQTSTEVLGELLNLSKINQSMLFLGHYIHFGGESAKVDAVKLTPGEEPKLLVNIGNQSVLKSLDEIAEISL